MKTITIAIFFILCYSSLFSQDTTAEASTVAGLKRDCDDRIMMYLTPRGYTNNRNIDLTKYPKYDLTTNYLNPNWNQIKQGTSQGSCTSFAVAFAVSIQSNIDNYLFNKSRTLDLFSPAFIFNVAKSHYEEPFKSSCGEGISYIDAFLTLKVEGIPLYDKYKYIEASDGCFVKYFPKNDVFTDAKKRKIAIFQRPFRTVDNFKRILVDTPFYAICIGVILSSEYDKATDPKTGGLWKSIGQSNGTRLHAMLIVGFDNSKNAFKVMDWQGKDIGDNGFIWMDYNLIPNSNVVFDSYICSHGTEYIDPKVGSATRGVTSTYDTTETKCYEKDGISCYVKAAYYIVKDKFRIFCTYVSKSNKKAAFRIYNKYTNEIIADDLFVNEGGNNCFAFEGKSYLLNVIAITNRGTDILTKAAIVNVRESLNNECTIKYFPRATALENAINELDSNAKSSISGKNTGSFVLKYNSLSGLGEGQPWAATFVSWCYNKDIQFFKPTGNINQLEKYFSDRKSTFKILDSLPQPGDIYFYDWEGKRAVGIVEYFSTSDSVLHGIEGNSSENSKPPYDKVARVTFIKKEYDSKNLIFATVKYR